ncbi:uncharacterized protein LOC144160534 [Haemaphysalis longicornis]
MPYFVYVRFLFDNVRKITLSTNIKAFRPDSVLDFTAGDMHSVYWEGNATTKRGYYEAELLHMTESKEEMDEYISLKRVTATKRKQPATAPKTLKRCRLMAKEAVAGKVLSDLALTKEVEKLKKEIFEVKSENQRLRALNMTLQEQLLHYMTKPATQGQSTASSSGTSLEEPGCSFWTADAEEDSNLPAFQGICWPVKCPLKVLTFCCKTLLQNLIHACLLC